MKPSSQKRASKLLEIGLIALVVLAVASFGGTETISWDIVQAVLLLLGIAVLLTGAIGFHGKSRFAFLGPVALLIFLGIQLLRSHQSPVILDPSATRSALIRVVSYLCAFYVTLAVARAPEARRRLALALVALGVFEALYGLIQYLTGWQQIFTYVKTFYVEDASGTYINHNHFAGFLEMVIPPSVGLACYHMERATGRAGQRRRRTLGELLGRSELQKSLLLVFVSLLLLLAVVFSRSRMGLISCVTSLLVMAAILAGRKGGRAVSAILIVVLLIAGVGSAFWIGVEPIVSRFAILPSQEFFPGERGGRLAVWKDTAKLIRQHPWFGVGLGSFETAYTQVQTVHLDSVVDHAHNDYIELTAELGLVGAGLLFGLVLVATAKTLHASYTCPESAERPLALGAFGGIVALLLHSMADFNLHIPANGLVFALLLGLGCSTASDLSANASPPYPND